MSTTSNKRSEKKGQYVQGSLFDSAATTRPDAMEHAEDAAPNLDGQRIVLLGLSRMKGLGMRTLQRLYDVGIVQQFSELDDLELAKRLDDVLAGKQAGLAAPILGKRQQVIEQGARVLEELKRQWIQLIFSTDGEYPQNLNRLQDPPRWIFLQGDVRPLHSTSIISMIGTRRPSETGMKLSRAGARSLVSKNFVVLSGMAKGIDEEAHWGAVEEYGQTVAILGHGMFINFTRDQEDLANGILANEGALVSEYLPTDPPTKHGFLRRNELIAALSGAVIPVECPSLNSGTGATIRRALNIKTPVIGIIPAGVTEPSLLQTSKNLQELSCEVFTINNGGTSRFWSHLQSLFPSHKWSPDHQNRQERFFRTIESIILPMSSRLGLDDDAIDRLALRLKEALEEQRGRSSDV